MQISAVVNRFFTCWERADLLAIICDVLLFFVTLPCGVLGKVWCLIVSIPDLCLLSYFNSIFTTALKRKKSFFLKMSIIAKLFCLQVSMVCQDSVKLHLYPAL